MRILNKKWKKCTKKEPRASDQITPLASRKNSRQNWKKKVSRSSDQVRKEKDQKVSYMPGFNRRGSTKLKS